MLPKEISDVVKLHSGIAVGSAWIPIPGVDVAVGAGNIWTMYVRINDKIGLSIKDNILKTIASGVLTNLAGYLAVTEALRYFDTHDAEWKEQHKDFIAWTRKALSDVKKEINK